MPSGVEPRLLYRHRHDAGAAGETVCGIHPGRFAHCTEIRRHRPGSCHQRSHAGWAVASEPEIRTDRAIPAVLLVNELITNAAKYAYPAGNCRVWVALSRDSNDTIVISVRDEGVRLPPTFDIKSGRRLGMRLVESFSQQLGGDLQVARKNPGTEFVLTMPLNPPR